MYASTISKPPLHFEALFHISYVEYSVRFPSYIIQTLQKSEKTRKIIKIRRKENMKNSKNTIKEYIINIFEKRGKKGF